MKKIAAVHIASVLALAVSFLLLHVHGGNTQDTPEGLQNSKQTSGRHTGALTVVPNEEEEEDSEDNDGVVSVEVDEYDEEDLEVFYPTKEWQTIKPGQAIPAGLHVSIDLTTGEKRAKLMDNDDDHSTEDEDPASRHMKWTDGDRQGMVNTKNKYFTASELKEALKKFKADQDDVSEAGQQKLKDVKDQYRSYDELKEIFQQMRVDVETDTEIMQKLLLAYTEEGASDDMRLHVLTELEYHVHQIDNAQNLIELGGFQLVILALNDSNSDIRAEAARVLGAAVQSNPKVQIEALESGAVPTLIRLVASDSSIAVRKKSLYALSSLVRQFPLAQLRFLQQGGLSCLAQLFGDPNATTLRIKAVTLLHDLMVEQVDRKIEVDDDCEDPNSNVCHHQQHTGTQGRGLTNVCHHQQQHTGTQGRGLTNVCHHQQHTGTQGRGLTNVCHHQQHTGTQERGLTNNGTYSQLPVTAGFVGNQNYGPGDLQREEIQGPSASSIRDDETKENNSNTNEINDNPGNDVYHCINDDEINNQQQAAHQSPHGEQPSAEHADDHQSRHLGQPSAEDADDHQSRHQDQPSAEHADDHRIRHQGQPSAEDADDHQSRHLGQPSAKDADDKGRNSLFKNPMYATGALGQDDGDNNDAADSCVFFHRHKLLLLVIIAMTVAAAIGAGAGLATYFTTVQKAHPLSPNSSLERSAVYNLSASKTNAHRYLRAQFPTTEVCKKEYTCLIIIISLQVFRHNAEGTRFDQIQTTTKEQPLTTRKEVWYQRLGCWKDSTNRAIPSLEGTDSRLADTYVYRSNPIEKCYLVAHFRRFTVFAVQDGGACFGSADGLNTYYKYGSSSVCGEDGEGGNMANEVYQIGVNVALGKTAFQTSTPYTPFGVACVAVDGGLYTNYKANSCTHTTEEDNPTWWVDLGQPYVMRLNPFNIHIGNSDQVSTNPKCGGDHHINLNQPAISISCQGMKGRYVGVRLPGSSRLLSLCEVKVLAVRPPE
uniref:Nucleotide exchange factor SIL1 n=1 Tax=Branchiostoma floridae TaxID=7739 RepID=C3XZU0_BRAFL|eukprot:XP_002610478.1 hypothetical protein BRAFLDRAFT_85619 [Branchiostoma floridae]